MKKLVLLLAMKMMVTIIIFLFFLWLCILMIQKANYEAALLSMLLMLMGAVGFSFYKEQYVALEDDEAEN